MSLAGGLGKVVKQGDIVVLKPNLVEIMDQIGAGHPLPKLDGLYKDVYYLNRRYYEADVIISLPTLKNHWDAAVTGAVKNLAIGGTPANIYGAMPDDFLRWPAIPHGNDDYHAFMHDFYKCKPAGFFKDGFDRISIPIKDLAAGEHRIRVAAYDRFLNDLILERTLVKE